MPTYEYVCPACGHAWEEIQKISEPPVQQCPSCTKQTAKRQISGGSFILKGGGWYADAYSSPKPAKSESADGAKAPAKDAKPEAKGAGAKESKDASSASSAPAKPASTSGGAASGLSTSGGGSSGAAGGGSGAKS